MIRLNTALTLALALSASLISFSKGARAQRLEICSHIPRYGWVSVVEVEARLKAGGFRLLRLRITNEACYLALVENAGGEKLEMRLHPGSSEILDVSALRPRGGPPP